MMKKILTGMVELLMLVGLIKAVPMAALAGAEGYLSLVRVVELTVTVDQEILCNPCTGTIHWGDPADSQTEVFADDNSADQSFSYAQAGCYEPQLVVHNSESNEEATYTVGKLAVGAGASCPAAEGRALFFPLQFGPLPTSTPTLTPTVTPTPTVAPTPEACPGDPIADPSFEQRCGWEFSGRLDPWYTRTLHKDGSRSLGLGVPPGEADDLPAYSQASQWITIPAWASTLKGYFYSESNETSSSAGPLDAAGGPQFSLRLPGGGVGFDRAVDTDTVFLYISKAYDDDLRRVIWEPNYNNPAWKSFETDISPWRGQTVLLIFGLGADGDGRASRVFFDNFSVR